MHESEKKRSRSVMSNSQRPQGLQPTRLLCPWDSPGRSTGVRAIAFVIRKPLTRVLRRGRVCKWIPRWCTAPRYSFCLPQADLRTPVCKTTFHGKKPMFLFYFISLHFPVSVLTAYPQWVEGESTAPKVGPGAAATNLLFSCPSVALVPKRLKIKGIFSF